MDPGGNPAMASLKPRKGGHHVIWPPPKKNSQETFIFYFILFLKVNLGPSKKSGLNPWSFQFWGYHRLEPRSKLPPPLNPAAGSASGAEGTVR